MKSARSSARSKHRSQGLDRPPALLFGPSLPHGGGADRRAAIPLQGQGPILLPPGEITIDLNDLQFRLRFSLGLRRTRHQLCPFAFEAGRVAFQW